MRNELWNGGGNVGGGFGRLDVFEGPRLLSLCHNFKTKDSVFGQIHVPLEQSGLRGALMHSLALEVAGEGSLAIGAIQQGPVSIGAEGSGKDRDIAKDALVFVEMSRSVSSPLTGQLCDGVQKIEELHTSRGLSKILDILYSKFWDAARGLVSKRLHARPVSTQILMG